MTTIQATLTPTALAPAPMRLGFGLIKGAALAVLVVASLALMPVLSLFVALVERK